MFSTLIESSPRRDRRTAQSVLSLLLHAALGVGAVEATRHAASAVPERPRADTMIYVVPPPPPATSQPVPMPGGPTVPALPEAAPMPVVAPTVIPVGLPPIEPGPAVDPRRFVLASPVPECRECQPGPASPDGPGVFTAMSVDSPVEPVFQPVPVYPPVLRTAGLEGRVVVRFVVDTLGRVEPGSFEVVETTHAGFVTSAEAAVAGSRFRAAKVRGRPVRQLVTQAVTFRIE